jgi:hypothetical protein
VVLTWVSWVDRANSARSRKRVILHCRRKRQTSPETKPERRPPATRGDCGLHPCGCHSGRRWAAGPTDRTACA